MKRISHTNHSLMRSMIAAVLALICFVTPLFVGTASATPAYQEGDIVTFGCYEQDNITPNGAEKIEWIVLDVKSDRKLLLSRYALDSERYHYRGENVDWNTCSLREWLNRSFINDAFSFLEQRNILSDFSDAVFVLSQEEVEYYLPQFKDRICYPTAYCAGQNVYVNPTTGGSWWLLRTPGDNGSKFVMSVNSDGTMDYKGGHVESERGVVRPAIWARISAFANGWYCPSCERYSDGDFCPKDGTKKPSDPKANAKRSNTSRYATAEALERSGKTAEAAIAYYKLGDKERSFALWNKVIPRKTLSTGGSYTVGIKTDGTVVAVGYNNRGQCDVGGWKDIIDIRTPGYCTVGLKADGTVVTAGYGYDNQCDYWNWRDIVTISVSSTHSVGLKADGTVVAGGDNTDGQCNVENWRDIVAVSAGGNHTVGLKADGTVVATGGNWSGQCDVSSWRNIITVSAGVNSTIGLKADGTVITAGKDDWLSRFDIRGWRDIVSYGGGDFHYVGLKSDGTVVTVGSNDYGQCDVGGWRNIVDIEVGPICTVGLKSDGTVVIAGIVWECDWDVSGWRDIVAIYMGGDEIFGLKSDGTVVFTGFNGDHEGDVSGWRNIRLPSKLS